MRVHVMQQCRPPACRLVRWWKEIITRRTPSPRAAGFGQSWYGVSRVGGSSTSSSLHCHDAFQMPGALQSSDISRPPHTLNDAPCPPLRLVFASTASSSQAQNLKRRVLAALIFIASAHRSSCHRPAALSSTVRTVRSSASQGQGVSGTAVVLSARSIAIHRDRPEHRRRSGA